MDPGRSFNGSRYCSWIPAVCSMDPGTLMVCMIHGIRMVWYGLYGSYDSSGLYGLDGLYGSSG
jgi:hypothetical protein